MPCADTQSKSVDEFVLELLDVIETLAKLEGIADEQVQVNELRLEIKNRTTL
jgi:hypothetical protein